MPKTWGVSGDRMLLSFDLNFTSSRYNNGFESFLEGVAGAKHATVVGNVMHVGPTRTENEKSISIKDGGWRIVRGKGPSGADVMRFFVELEEKVERSDVHIPAGRIYFACGYYPLASRSAAAAAVGGTNTMGLERETLEEEERRAYLELEILKKKMAEASEENGLETLRASWALLNKCVDHSCVEDKLEQAKLREPELDDLRLSEDRTVALTREGSLCTKVNKLIVTEYHVLGRFGIARSVERHRDNNDDDNKGLKP